MWLRRDSVGANTDEVEAVDSAGITVSAARWLLEERGALIMGSDTSALEVTPPPEQLPDGASFNPVHVYLLVRQGVHILELNDLEDLARDRVYKLAYVISPNKIRSSRRHGAAAGRARLRRHPTNPLPRCVTAARSPT